MPLALAMAPRGPVQGPTGLEQLQQRLTAIYADPGNIRSRSQARPRLDLGGWEGWARDVEMDAMSSSTSCVS